MSKLSLVASLGLIFLLTSWNSGHKRNANSNSWNVKIGKTVILASWNKNEMGETAVLKVDKLKITDTLVASRFLCGGKADGCTVSLKLTDQKGNLVNESVNTENTFSTFSAEIPVSKFYQSLRNGLTLSINFSITSENINSEVLLGTLVAK